MHIPFLIVSFFIFFVNFFHISLSKNSGAEPMPIKPLTFFWNFLIKFKAIQEPILDPIIIKFKSLNLDLITLYASFVQLEIFPSVNFPYDFPCPEYSSAKKLIFFL